MENEGGRAMKREVDDASRGRAPAVNRAVGGRLSPVLARSPSRPQSRGPDSLFRRTRPKALPPVPSKTAAGAQTRDRRAGAPKSQGGTERGKKGCKQSRRRFTARVSLPPPFRGSPPLLMALFPSPSSPRGPRTRGDEEVFELDTRARAVPPTTRRALFTGIWPGAASGSCAGRSGRVLRAAFRGLSGVSAAPVRASLRLRWTREGWARGAVLGLGA
ncbi:hypothetical protein CDD83_4100 [Cordyceps sp. RAO-2017]|nr:hypothetical protein CDD83_4100 [Cordyceps sp. RAO-2017]